MVDVRLDRHAISQDIYGVNFADAASATRLGITVDRWGGNGTSRYNRNTGFHNTGSDWYFENIPPDPGALPHRQLIAGDRRVGMRTVLTVPLIGWTPKPASSDAHPYACGFRVSRYGSQESTDPWDADCGNGVRNGSAITSNDPADTSVAIGPGWVRAWVEDLVAEYGHAAAGRVRYS